MKKLGATRWLVVSGAFLLVVSLGAVACGSDEVQAGVAQGQRGGDQVQAGAEGGRQSGRLGQKPAIQRLKDAKERREAHAQRQRALLENLRDKMSAEDQVIFDELSASIEQQQAALREARQELADTLKELRALVDGYLDLSEPVED